MKEDQEFTEASPEPFFFPGGSVGILLVHGFTGSPSEMRPMGQWFAQQGYTVAGPLLAGHGTSPLDMERTGWRDWVASARDAAKKLRERSSRIVAAGLSMGGALSLYLGSGVAGVPVDAVISMCAPIYLQDRRAHLARFVAPIHPFHRDGSAGHPPEIRRYLAGYDITPTRCVGELMTLIRRTKRLLPGVRVPTLVLQARRDRTVRPKSAQYIYARVGTSDKALRWYEQSGHILTVDRDREAVWRDVLDWLRGHDLAPR
ncbi:alpha/beta hydrolase [Kyrpidia tusciae]|uniref:Carboxylesterase n=1 Tax=Kyrpidia tusciae (strain DSM 2912 / NBRC 15312 / T2) TaxID=562970 RepID=D5WR85_KYRT2|nr:alpha/beta fold hydrolase [Kyrpidia tusciae]ADG06815.1 Carboxylesterase [Kyrpidia tusciae DSM 2912]